MWFVGQPADMFAEAAGLPRPGAQLVVFEADA